MTTCISYERPPIDDQQLVQGLDVTAGNPYYMMQEALHIGVEVPRAAMWWSSGVWALYEQGDRMFSSAQAPFLVTETNAQSIGQSHWEHQTPYPGQIALAGLALVARGARMIEYWQWQTLHYGIETYWGGVLPHSGRPGRIYREIAELGHRLRDLGPQLEGFTPDADVALLYSIDTKHSFEFYPPLADAEGGPDRASYLRIFDRYYRAAFEAGVQSRIVHADQFRQRDAADFVAEFPTLVVPTLYIADDDMLDALVRYAEAGGHLVVGIRTGYGDQLARARPERAPGRLADAAGVWYDEYSTLDAPVGIDGTTFGGGQAEGWADALVADGADVVAAYSSGIYAGRPAVTSREHGAGRVTYVGTLPDLALATSILRWAVPITSVSEWQLDATVTVTSGSSTVGRVWFISNWSPEPATAHPPQRLGGTPIVLEPWGVTVLVEQRDPESGAVPTSNTRESRAIMRHGARKAAFAITSIAAVAALALTGCTSDGGSGGDPGTITDAQREEALNTPTDLTFWTWVPDIQDQVDLFEAEYPEINVTVENVGQGLDHYAKVRTAAEAGSGGPDVVQLEYQFISSFALSGELLDLTPYGAEDIADDYVSWVWNQGVHNGEILAIPQDSGPLGNLYREDILTAAGVTEAPATWEDYKTAAEAVRDNTDAVHLEHGSQPGRRMARAVVAGGRQAVRLRRRGERHDQREQPRGEGSDGLLAGHDPERSGLD